MRSLRPTARKSILTPAEWEFLENLKAMRESRCHPDYEGDSGVASKRQGKSAKRAD